MDIRGGTFFNICYPDIGSLFRAMRSSSKNQIYTDMTLKKGLAQATLRNIHTLLQTSTYMDLGKQIFRNGRRKRKKTNYSVCQIHIQDWPLMSDVWKQWCLIVSD